MQKLYVANLQDSRRDAGLSAAAVVGMAALWLSIFKQLLYPVLFAYYRTGDEGALLAQGAYAIALVGVTFALLMAHAKLAQLAERRRWAVRWTVAALGAAGAAGIALRAFSDSAWSAGEAAMCFGAALSAAYVPVHFAFWASLARPSREDGDSQGSAAQAVGLSFALFLALYALLSATGANTVFVSIACPLVSSAMALVCPWATENRPDSEPASAHEPTPQGEFPEAAPSLPAGFAEAFDLSEREAELAAYAHRNLSARRIAGELYIAESTVYTHLKRIYRKTDVHSKHELIDLIDSWQATR